MSEDSNKISFPGEVNLNRIDLITWDERRIDISAMVAEISIYEDIFSNTLSGHILIEDSLDLINSAPLIGQEQIIIELQTPTLTEKISKSFYVYKLQYRTANKRSQSYMLNFCSKELIFSANSKVAQAFSGNISDNVISIFKDARYLASRKDLFVEKTKNNYNFIAPYWTPLETINWLTTKSINARGVPNYLFFETNQTFEYVSVDTLMRGVPVRSYIYSDVDANTAYGADGDKESKYNIVESITTATTFDYLRNLNAGMYSSRLVTYDMTTRTINSNTFDYIQNFKESSHLEDNPLKTDTLLRKKIASLYFIEKNNYQSGNLIKQGYSDFFLQRNSLLEQLSAFKISIKVPGRTDMKVGMVVNFTMSGMRQILKDEIATASASDYYSGRYLITAIRHQIINGAHSMLMEIVSDSFIKPLVATVETSGK